MIKAPSFASMFRYLDKPELSPLLKALIERSAQPLSAIETDMAVDSSGFSSSVYDRWFDHKWGRERKAAKWVKAHIICGVKTNVVVSAEVKMGNSADSPQLPGLANTAALSFDVQEVSADKAYSGHRNLNAIAAAGAKPLIPFKDNTVPRRCEPGRTDTPDGQYRMVKGISFLRLQPGGVQSALSQALKRGDDLLDDQDEIRRVRSVQDEVLAKILCHNICVLIQSFYELGITPSFLDFETEQPPVSIFSRNGHF